MAQRAFLVLSLMAGAATLALGPSFGTTAPAVAAPFALPAPAAPAPIVEQTQVFKRGRPPRYPFVYNPPRRPGGWSTYFGFVPYEKGDYETQALQRLYPQLNYPPSMRYWTPQSQF
mgnify:CR=1 FL=1